MGGGLAVAVLAQRMLAGLPPVLNGPLDVAALLEVHRQLPGDLAGAMRVAELDAFAGPQMARGAVSAGDARVEHALIQGVDEGVAPRHGPIGPFGDAGGAEELTAAGERLAAAFALAGVDAVGNREGGGELGAGDARDREHGLLGGVEALDLLVDHLPEGFRGGDG